MRMLILLFDVATQRKDSIASSTTRRAAKE